MTVAVTQRGVAVGCQEGPRSPRGRARRPFAYLLRARVHRPVWTFEPQHCHRINLSVVFDRELIAALPHSARLLHEIYLVSSELNFTIVRLVRKDSVYYFRANRDVLLLVRRIHIERTSVDHPRVDPFRRLGAGLDSERIIETSDNRTNHLGLGGSSEIDSLPL